MLNLKSLLKPRNGSSAGAREIAAAIEQLEMERAAAEREIERLDDADTDLLAENDIDGLDESDRKRTAQQRKIKKADNDLPKLREHLAAVREHERATDFLKHREAIWNASEHFVVAARKAHEALSKLIALREQTAAAGFLADVLAIPMAPGLVNLAEPGQPQLEHFVQAFSYYRQHAAAGPVPKPLPPTPSRQQRFVHLPPDLQKEAADRGGVALYQTPPAADPEAAKRAAAALKEGHGDPGLWSGSAS